MRGLRAGLPLATGGRLLACLAVAVCATPVAARAGAPPVLPDLQSTTETEFFLTPPRMASLQLAHRFLVPGSTRVFVDGASWREGTDYRVRARSGLVVPLREWAPPEAKDKVLVAVSYRFLPVPLAPRRDLRPMATAPPSRTDAAREVAGLQSGTTAWRSNALRVSGSKTVQVASGSRREMTVDQNLRLSIVGQLTDAIAVKAFLSDDNLPVVPEGNTEQLRDIDKVLVTMQAPEWEATLGDFVARRAGSAFGSYRRKLQGVSLQATPGRSQIEVLAGSPRGAYRTVQLQGQEANQGPYALAGGAAAGNLFVVAGSERVSVDGEVLTRGAERDYVIDYVLGTVTFTFRRLITAESLITVEFEEGEGAYGRTVSGAGAGHAFTLPVAGVEGSFLARVIREKDDLGRLRTGELGPDDESVLAAAGDDPERAIANGVTVAQPGAGQYEESLIDGKTIYTFAPEGGTYDIVFFYRGPGLGDYRLERLTETGGRVFSHVGDDLGSYRIGRPLPLPEQHSVATLSGALGDTAGSHLRGEWNVARTDRNQLSERDDGDNSGWAGRFDLHLSERSLNWRGRGLGRIGVTGFWEKREASFQPFQLRKTRHAYEAWGLGDRARRQGFLDEADRETGLSATWRVGDGARMLRVGGQLGSLGHGIGVGADQSAVELEWNLWGGTARHRLQQATATDLIDPLDVHRRGSSHELSWRFGPVQPHVRYEQRRWRDDALPTGRAAGFRMRESVAGLRAVPGSGLGWRLEFQRGLADSLEAGGWRLQRDSRTLRAGATTGEIGGMRLVGETTIRRILQPAGPEQTTRLARFDVTGRWDRSASDWALGYRVDNSRSEVLDRQIIFVGEGLGDFNQDGLFVGEELGDYDMVLAGTDSLVATTAVRADLNWRQGFRFLGAERWYGAWSTMTLASVEGRSTTDDVGGLLTLDPEILFDRDATVLADLKISEEVTLLQHLRRVDLRARFDFRQTQDRQFVDHHEDRLDRAWQATGHINASRRTSVKLRWVGQDERRHTAESSSSARRSQVVDVSRYELGWIYNPSSDLRLSVQGEHVARGDAVSGVQQSENALRPSVRSRIAGRWTFQADVRWSRVESDEPAGAVRPVLFPFPGDNVESSLRLSWDPSRLMTVSASWFGRRRGERGWQHDLRLETTARF